MKRTFKRNAVIAVFAAVFSLPLMAQDDEPVFGRQLMTQEEMQEHQRMMQSFDTPEERQAYREEHHQRMLERARARGVTLPQEPGMPGKGMKHGMGMDSGQGMGPGQGMGQGKGQSR